MDVDGEPILDEIEDIDGLPLEEDIDGEPIDTDEVEANPSVSKEALFKTTSWSQVDNRENK